MKEISIEELKDLQTGIALKIHDFCLEHGIRYFLGYGSLIGAAQRIHPLRTSIWECPARIMNGSSIPSMARIPT